MKFEDQNDRDKETLSDLALTTEEGNEVRAGTSTIGVDSGTQLTIQGQVSSSAAGGGGGAGKCQLQDFHFVAK